MKALGRWEVTLPGESYVWEPDEVTVAECLMLETESGLTFPQWILAIDDERAEACQILVWFLRHKAGRQEDRFAVDFPLRKLEIREIGEEGDDPEGSAGSGPATEQPSPSTTESAPGSGTS